MQKSFFERYGVIGSSLIISVSSIFLSVSLSFLIRFISGTAISPGNLVIAAIIPLVMAPPLTYLISRTMVQQIEMGQKLERFATIDQLTGVMNRSKFFETADELLGIATEIETIGVAVIDIDRFKAINDTYGHLVGDDALRLIANTIEMNLRKGDVFGRFGGDEFILLAPNTTRREMEKMCQRALTMIQTLSVGKGEERTCLSATIGVTVVLPANDSITNLIARADAALLQAKRDGGGQILVN